MVHKDIRNLLLGQAQGDAQGLPFEGMNPIAIQKLKQKGRLGFLGTKWLIFSDDTEHAVMTLNCLISEPKNSQALSPYGVSGHAIPSALVALHAWHSHRGSLNNTIEAVISCGGDTDSVAAIAGALAGVESQHPSCLENVKDFPLSKKSLITKTKFSIPYFLFFIRNTLILPIAVLHVLVRRFL